MSLDTRPSRTDLTDRECANILGGLIGSLCNMADRDKVRAALRWWAETDRLWSLMPETAAKAREQNTKAAKELFVR